MADRLPALPSPDQWGYVGHSDDQMRAYARQAVAEALEAASSSALKKN